MIQLQCYTYAYKHNMDIFHLALTIYLIYSNIIHCVSYKPFLSKCIFTTSYAHYIRFTETICIFISINCVCAVSYTHLDVYKRQTRFRNLPTWNVQPRGGITWPTNVLGTVWELICKITPFVYYSRWIRKWCENRLSEKVFLLS